jgi:hypothetical protein
MLADLIFAGVKQLNDSLMTALKAVFFYRNNWLRYLTVLCTLNFSKALKKEKKND